MSIVGLSFQSNCLKLKRAFKIGYKFGYSIQKQYKIWYTTQKLIDFSQSLATPINIPMHSLL